MAKKPKPKVMSIQGSHFDITGPGPFLLPALFSPLSIVDRGEEDRALIRAVSDENQQLQLDISIQAAASLVKAKRPGLLPAPEPARVLQIAGMREPIELPYLFSFVRFVAVEKTFRVLEFLNDEHQRIHVGLSSEAYTDLLMLLRVLPKTKSHQQER